VLRGPDGKPDLQGFWDFRSLTPLERPVSQADKPFLTDAEAAAIQRQNADRRRAPRPRATPGQLRERPVVADRPLGVTTISGLTGV